MCLYGPPGTGKSAFAQWLARELDRPLHVHRGADLLSMWLGGTEKQIAQAFLQAEQARAVLLIDEIDGFLQDRRQAQRQWEVTQVNEMLTRMEAFEGILIATTNLMAGLDQAAMRRFDLKLHFDYLANDQAWQLFQQHCDELGLQADAISQQRLKRLDQLTPGDFAAVARRNRFTAFDSATAMANALAEEVALKTDNHQRPIGFTG
jgi:SpoVK/Ycf46/Vps4 family AAA+-type ATPase